MTNYIIGDLITVKKNLIKIQILNEQIEDLVPIFKLPLRKDLAKNIKLVNDRIARMNKLPIVLKYTGAKR